MDQQKMHNILRSLSKKDVNKTLRQSRGRLSTSVTRVKRIRTLERQNPADNDLLEKELQQLGFHVSFLREVFRLRSQDNQIKPNDAKYGIFLTSFLQKVKQGGILSVSVLLLKQQSFAYFMKQVPKMHNISRVDLSGHRVHSADDIIKLLERHIRLVDIRLCNMGLMPQHIDSIVSTIIQKQHIVKLDLSNYGSEHLNKFNEEFTAINNLISNNKTIVFVDLNGLNIRDKGMDVLERAYRHNASQPLLYLSLRNNHITGHSFGCLQSIIYKSQLKQLILADNPLGDANIEILGELKNTNMQWFDLSCCGIESRGFIAFMEQAKESKELQTLIFDRNDLSGNWFMRIQDTISQNKSLKELRLVDCRIKYLEALFAGLQVNPSLTKLNVSKNGFDAVKFLQLAECIKRNVTLKELKMRFCGLNETGCINIGKALENNRSLKLLDISENSVGAAAGKQLLACIYNNSTLTHLIVEKTQIEMSVRKFLQQRLQSNRTIRTKNERRELAREGAMMRQKDMERKENLADLEQLKEKNTVYLEDLKKLVDTLNHRLAQSKKHHQQKMNIYDMQLATINRELMKMQVDARPIIKQLQENIEYTNHRIEEAQEQKQIQLRRIKQLQQQLQNEKIRVRKVEDSLQERLQNEKYINKKKSVSLPKIQQHQFESPQKNGSRPSSRVVEIRTAGKVQLKRTQN